MFWALDAANIPSSASSLASSIERIPKAPAYLRDGARLAATLLQLRLNYKCGTFAGDYALAALMRVPWKLLMIPQIINARFRRNEAVEWRSDQLVSWITTMLWAYQALTLPRVEQDEAEKVE